MRVFAILLTMCVVFLSSCREPLTLAGFIFKDQELPGNCRIVSVKPGEELPCGIKSNPFVSSERQFLDCFARMLVDDESLVAATRSALFSLYKEKGEIGVCGLEFDSETSASQTATLLREKNTDVKRFAIFQKGRIAILLWRDDETDTCFDRLKEAIEARIK